jgi:hypothetical protein
LKLRATSGLILLSLTLAGCGTVSLAGNPPSRSTLAKRTIISYWSDINHAKMSQAYRLLTPGVREGITKADFANNFIGLLTNASTIGATVNNVQVNGDTATAKVTLTSPKDHPLHAWQHLFWVNGGWHISDNNAFLSHHK